MHVYNKKYFSFNEAQSIPTISTEYPFEISTIYQHRPWRVLETSRFQPSFPEIGYILFHQYNHTSCELDGFNRRAERILTVS